MGGGVFGCTHGPRAAHEDGSNTARANEQIVAARTPGVSNVGLIAAARSAGARPTPRPKVTADAAALLSIGGPPVGPLTPVRLGVPRPAAGQGELVAVEGGPAPDATLASSASLIRDVRPWRLGSSVGQAVLTDHFVVYSTERSAQIGQGMPGFLEAALTHYRSFVVPLPAPGGTMDTYVLADRAQWQALTRMLLGETQSRAIASVQRGGMTFKGRALLFDMGPADTLAIAAHEGWHQYTQVTFRQPLPVWLEECVATLAEGHAWAGSRPVFLPWANPARFDRLRETVDRGELMSIEQIIAGSPANLLDAQASATGVAPGRTSAVKREAAAQDTAAAWYSQVWALGLFLKHHAGPGAAAGLGKAVIDASEGRVGLVLSQGLGLDQSQATRAMLGPGAAAVHFGVYFGASPEAGGELDRRFREFVHALVQPGGREAITKGRSPLAEPQLVPQTEPGPEPEGGN